MNLPDYKFFRRTAGLIFLAGNIFLFISNVSNTNWYQLSAGLLFTTCSISLILSARHHRFLFYSAFSVLVACLLVSVSSPGNGQILTYLSGIAGFAGGFLTLRAALQRETHKQYSLPYFLSGLDKYPIAASGLIQGPCFLATGIGAAINSDDRLMIVSFLWVAGYLCLIFSDEYLRQSIKRT